MKAKRVITADRDLTDLTSAFWQGVYKAQVPAKRKVKGENPKWPIRSSTLGVHPDLRDEAIEDAKRKGVPTEFLPDGRPLMTSNDHYRRYCRAYGFRHRGLT